MTTWQEISSPLRGRLLQLGMDVRPAKRQPYGWELFQVRSGQVLYHGGLTGAWFYYKNTR